MLEDVRDPADQYFRQVPVAVARYRCLLFVRPSSERLPASPVGEIQATFIFFQMDAEI